MSKMEHHCSHTEEKAEIGSNKENIAGLSLGCST